MIERIEHKLLSTSPALPQHRHDFEFLREFWEKKSILLAGNQTLGLPKFGEEELFRAVVAIVEDFCKHGRQKVRFYVNGSEVDIFEEKYQAILPKFDDGSFIRYNHRMIERSGFEDYALIIADWHQFDRSLWERILDFVQGLTNIFGISRSRMDTQIFVGTYKVTPFGVHIDPTSAFHFPIIGRKIMRFWESSFTAKTPALQRAQNYEAFLEDSVLIQANPGEVIYWPSDYWHVGESDGDFSVTWGLGYWMGDNVRKLAIEKAMKVFEEMKTDPVIIQPHQLAHAAETMCRINEVMADLVRAVSNDRFRQLMVQSWFEHYSAYGFLRVPPLLEEIKIDDRILIRKKPVFQVLHASIEKSLVCIASAGRSCVLPKCPAVQMVIDRLNEGCSLSPAEMFGDNDAPSEVIQLINFLLRNGTLMVI